MSYTIANVFLPQDGSAVDGLTVEAFKVSTWSGTNTPPHLGDTPPASPDATTTTSTNFGNHGAWELALPTNEDYFVVVEYSSSYYWQRYNAPAWTDGATVSELDVAILDASTSITINGIEIDGLSSDPNPPSHVQSVGTLATTTGSASGGSINLGAYVDHVHAGLGQPIAVDSAPDGTQYVGGTIGGAPSGGTYTPTAGDFAVDQQGAIWIYNGSSWVALTSAANAGATGDIKAIAGPVVPSGWLACDGSAVSRTTYADLFTTISFPQSTDTLSGQTHSNTTIDNIKTNGVAGGADQWQVGWPISGTGIPAGTYITAIVSDVEVTISQAATSSGTPSLVVAPWGVGDGSSTFNLPDLRGRTAVGASVGANAISLTGDTSSGSNVISGLAFSSPISINSVVPGAFITGAGIPADTTVTEVLTATSIQISNNATGTGSGVTFTSVLPVGAFGGAGTHKLSQGEMPIHNHENPNHSHYDPGHAHEEQFGFSSGSSYYPEITPAGNLGVYGYGSTNNATTNLASASITIDTAGGDDFHNITQPFAGVTYIVKS